MFDILPTRIRLKWKEKNYQVENVMKVSGQEGRLHVPVRFGTLHALVRDVGRESLVQPEK